MLYGFRLFDYVIRDTTKRTDLPMESIGTKERPAHYVDYLPGVLRRLERRLLVGDPKLTPEDAPGDVVEVEEAGPIQDKLRGKVAFRLEHFQVEGRIVHGVMRKGIYGSHDVALGPDDEATDLPLDGRAPSSAYRFLINLPQAGTTGMMAVEAIGTSSPADHFARWLRFESRAWSADQYAAAQAAATSEDDVSKRPTWWNPVARQLTDPNHLDRLLRDGQFGELRLEKRSYGAGRGKRGDLTYRITAPTIPDGKVTELRRIVRTWLRGDEDGNKPSDSEGASQLAALIDPRDLADINFDDGYIKLDEPGSKAVSPSRLRDMFTYPQRQGASDRPTDGLAFYRAVRDVAARLRAQTQDGLKLEWPAQVDVGAKG